MTEILIRSLGSMVTSLPSDQEVPEFDSRLSFGFFSIENYSTTYVLDISVFPCPSSIFCPKLSSGEIPCFLMKGQGRPTKCDCDTICGP